MLALALSLLACTGAPVDTDTDTDTDVERPVSDCTPTEERCNGVDDDCDSAVDELFDLDADGFLVDEAACRALGLPTDCDDDDAAINGPYKICSSGSSSSPGVTCSFSESCWSSRSDPAAWGSFGLFRPAGVRGLRDGGGAIVVGRRSCWAQPRCCRLGR